MNILVNILPVCQVGDVERIYHKFEAKVKLLLMNAAESILLRAALKQGEINKTAADKS